MSRPHVNRGAFPEFLDPPRWTAIIETYSTPEANGPGREVEATLDAPAAMGGAAVMVKSGSTLLGTIIFNAGQTSGMLTLTTHVPGSCTARAMLNGITKMAPLTVTP